MSPARLSDSLVAGAVRYRVSVLVAVLVVTAFFGYFMKDIRVENDPTKAVPPTMQAFVDYQTIQKALPSPRRVVCLAVFDSLRIQARTELLRGWAERFDSIDGIGNVLHLGAVRVPEAGGMFGLTSSPIVPTKGTAADEEVMERVRANREFTQGLISDDGTAMTMVMEVADDKNHSLIAAQALALVDSINASAPATLYLTGAPFYGYSIDQAMRRNLMVLLPICLVVVALLLYWVFRRVLYVVSSLGVIAVSLVWTFGLLGLTKSPFSVVTSVTPVILFPIGVAGAIHIFKTYARESGLHNGDVLAATQSTLRELFNPIFLSAITTFAGFFSFASSSVPWTRTFGIFTAIGVVFVLFLSLVLLPIVLSFDKPSTSGYNAAPAGAKEPPAWRLYYRFVFGGWYWAVLVAAALAMGIVGFMRVKIEGNPITMFPENGQVRRTDRLIGKYLGGTRFISILVERNGGTYQEKAAWDEIADVIDRAKADTIVGGVASLLPMINRVSMLLSDTTLSDAGLSMVLKSKSLLGKKLGRYINSWVTEDRTRTRIIVVCRNVPGMAYVGFAHDMKRYVESKYPHLRATVSGSPVINNATTFLLIDTQRSSLILAFSLVFLVLWLIFRSLRIGLIAIAPIMLSTLFVYGLMGLMGVPINMVTVVIVNTCIGMGIDYAIHFVAGYLYIGANYSTRLEALVEAARRKGAVIAFNTLVVGIGFMVLMLSTFPPIRDLGAFIFLSMLAGCTFALVFLPVMLKYLPVGKFTAHQKTGD